MDVLSDITPLALVNSLALAVALAASAGLRAWLPLLATGVLGRFELLQLGESFAFLTTTPVLVALGIATLLELLGDKLPLVDHALDVVSTVVRPAAGMLLAASVMWQVTDPMWALALGLVVGAPAAAVPHALKSSVRALSTTTTGGMANPFLSVIEDVIAGAMVVLAVLLPIVAAVLVALLAFVAVRLLTRKQQGNPTP